MTSKEEKLIEAVLVILNSRDYETRGFTSMSNEDGETLFRAVSVEMGNCELRIHLTEKL